MEILKKIIEIKNFTKFRTAIKEFELEERMYSKKHSFKLYILSLIKGSEYCFQKTRFFITNRIFTKTEVMHVIPFLIKNNDCENFKTIKNSLKDYEIKDAMYLSVQSIQDIEENNGEVGSEIYSLISSCIKELSKENNIFWWNDFFRNKDFEKKDIIYYFNKKFDFNINVKVFSRLLENFLKENLVIESYTNRVIKDNNLKELEQELKVFIQLYVDLPEYFRSSYKYKNIVRVFDQMIRKELFLLDCRN